MIGRHLIFVEPSYIIDSIIFDNKSELFMKVVKNLLDTSLHFHLTDSILNSLEDIWN